MTVEPWSDLLRKHSISEAGFPETDSEWRVWEKAQRALGKPTGEGGEGHSEYDPSVWMMGEHAPSHEKYYRQDSPAGDYHMPGITDPEEDDDEHREPTRYHVVTGPVDSQDPSEWTEHEYTMWEHPDDDYDADNAWDYFQEDHPQYNPERNTSATHEVKHVHPAENHDSWRNQLASEEEDFARIAPHGLVRESPEAMGHRAYRYEDPHGGIHRLWHNDTNFINVDDGTDSGRVMRTAGPGWRTSYWNPDLPQEQQMPWHFHDDDRSESSLESALERVERNKVHSDVEHAGAGLVPVGNLHGRHYVSARPGMSFHEPGGVLQMVRNQNYSGEPNWGVTYYPRDTDGHETTEHGSDLQGALEQARRNARRG